MTDALKSFAAKLSLPPLKRGGKYSIAALNGAADAFIAASLASEKTPVLVIMSGIPEAERITDDLRLITSRSPVRIMEFPHPKTLFALKTWTDHPFPFVLVTSVPALATKIPSTINSIEARTFSTLSQQLAKFGYRRIPQVEMEGDYSVRGGIIDVWSPGEEFPFRFEFFGEDLESTRVFNPANQLSINTITDARIFPVKFNPDEADHTLYDLLPKSTLTLTAEYPVPEDTLTIDFKTSPLPGFAELGLSEAHHPELFDDARKRLEQHLAAARKAGTKIFELDELSGGFEIPGFIAVTKADRVFTKHKVHTRALANSGARLNDFEDLEPGEYVVHLDYGVGRYIGSSEINLDGKLSEVFTIEYADGAKLHVPAAHAHLLSRYVGIKGEAVRIHRLDGKRWTKDKLDAEKAAADLAAALLDTQAKRETIPGFAYDTECEGLDAFEAAFAYSETPDQLAAIHAIKTDLASTKPMDRLICGDAGYGKTEVAMRAAFIAAMNGKQTAVLAPTTVLAEQHFETFTSRFDGTPVRIESVSRFQSQGTHAGTFKRLLSGACDIVIGTHAILSSKIRFHDLGLIIIDEEQRFGVRHKEFLKALRATADILTLSATPIPRTLYLSMTGARDLSLLRSPPLERTAVETLVVKDSDDTIKNAIEKELERGGQVYFLHNRVHSISLVEKRLKSLCPKAKITVAHGQMDALTLAKKMRAFERGEYDVLLSTTIIESGLNIPRANTILIDHAESFGLADLYQLRGRVGRSSRQGYAYLLLPPSGIIDSDATERLKALKRHGGLGGGFNLAVRDLELRGAGNLLGSQQSGHIAAVGFTLYCQLLKRTIAKLKGEKPKDIIDVTLNLDFSGCRLPYTYIEDDSQRLSMMKRFAEAQDESTVKRLAEELKDRFGPPPPEAVEYIHTAALRARCAAKNISRIDVSGKRAVFYLAGSNKAAFAEELKAKTADRKLAELSRLLAKNQ